jgi:plasmid stabilization system protein ParE
VRFEQLARAKRRHFLAERADPASAARLLKRFDDAAARLGRFPELGRVGRQEGTHELALGGTPYVFIFDGRSHTFMCPVGLGPVQVVAAEPAHDRDERIHEEARTHMDARQGRRHRR